MPLTRPGTDMSLTNRCGNAGSTIRILFSIALAVSIVTVPSRPRSLGGRDVQDRSRSSTGRSSYGASCAVTATPAFKRRDPWCVCLFIWCAGSEMTNTGPLPRSVPLRQPAAGVQRSPGPAPGRRRAGLPAETAPRRAPAGDGANKGGQLGHDCASLMQR